MFSIIYSNNILYFPVFVCVTNLNFTAMSLSWLNYLMENEKCVVSYWLRSVELLELLCHKCKILHNQRVLNIVNFSENFSCGAFENTLQIVLACTNCYMLNMD